MDYDCLGTVSTILSTQNATIRTQIGSMGMEKLIVKKMPQVTYVSFIKFYIKLYKLHVSQ